MHTRICTYVRTYSRRSDWNCDRFQRLTDQIILIYMHIYVYVVYIIWWSDRSVFLCHFSCRGSERERPLNFRQAEGLKRVSAAGPLLLFHLILYPIHPSRLSAPHFSTTKPRKLYGSIITTSTYAFHTNLLRRPQKTQHLYVQTYIHRFNFQLPPILKTYRIRTLLQLIYRILKYYLVTTKNLNFK